MAEHNIPDGLMHEAYQLFEGGHTTDEIRSRFESRGYDIALVDELIGKQEVVIKSLGTTFRSHNLLAGAAILGDGRVGLILDADSLVRIPVSSLNGGDSVGAPSTP